MIDVRSLAAFRRFLALPGATVTVTRHDWADAGKAGWNDPAKVAALYAPRTVGKLQGNAVRWSNGGWLHWDARGLGSHGAKNFRFDGATVTLDLSRAEDWSELCVYQLSIAEAAAA